MKKCSTLLILIAIATGSFGQIHANITVAQADSLINANNGNPSFMIIDFRTANEYATGHLPNAMNIDYYSPTLSAQLNVLDKDFIYLVHCFAGSRSAKAMDTMLVLGFKETYDMIGGINAWINAGFGITGTNETVDHFLHVDIHPNPATDYISISTESISTAGLTINIYDNCFSLVRTELLLHEGQKVNVSGLSSGMYLVEVKTRGKKVFKKLMIQR